MGYQILTEDWQGIWFFYTKRQIVPQTTDPNKKNEFLKTSVSLKGTSSVISIGPHAEHVLVESERFDSHGFPCPERLGKVIPT